MAPRKRRACTAAADSKKAIANDSDKPESINAKTEADEIVVEEAPKRVLRSRTRNEADTRKAKEDTKTEKVVVEETKRKRPTRSKTTTVADDKVEKVSDKDSEKDGTAVVSEKRTKRGRVGADATKENKDGSTSEISKSKDKKDEPAANVSVKKEEENTEKKSEPAVDTKSEEKSEEKSETKSKVVTVCYSGAVPVDVGFSTPDYRVYRDEKGRDWDCLLNQSNVGWNNNKFYIMQILTKEVKGTNQYCVWRRWGRIGDKGQSRCDNCSNIDEAKLSFEKLFRQKSGNSWSVDPALFVKYPGKYDLVERDFKTDETKDSAVENKKIDIPPSKLPDLVQDVISLICDVSRMLDQLKFLKYDATRAPLGKLSVKQIRLGYSALKDIESCLDGKKPLNELQEACSVYYTRIPHVFSRSKIELIDSMSKLKEELELLSSLENAEAAVTMFMEESATINPIDQKYKQLNCKIIPVDPDTDEYKVIEKSLLSTHATDNHRFKMEVLDIFELEKETEENCFKDLGNRRLLWHGSRMTNFAGILGKGLRIAPPEAPATGYMFGKGVYFADVSSKSAQYCYVDNSFNTAFMLLSEVSLGDEHRLTRAEYRLPQLLPKGKNSTHGIGQRRPEGTVDLKGLPLPMGPIVDQDPEILSGSKTSLRFNEYIVYSTEQIRMRYLLKLRIANR